VIGIVLILNKNMKQKLDLEEIKQKMFERLEPSGWGSKLKPFIFSGDFDKIITDLAKLATDGKRFTPPLKHIFRAFEECPVKDLQVVIVGQDPYPQFGVADGISFSCGNTMQLQPSLSYILNAVNDTVYDGKQISTDPDLVRWSNQGILMLNIALTTTVGKSGQHYQIWKPFLAYLFDYLSWHVNGLVYIYLGKEAKEWADCVNDNNYKLFATHPASAAYQKFRSWDCQDVFNKTSEIILKNNDYKIIW
jgi:uracil-DNA glycosylase